MNLTKQQRRLAAKVGVIFALIVGGVYAGFPVFWMAASSFKSNSEIFAYPPKIITKNFSFHAYSTILTDPVKVRFFTNSYVVSLSVCFLTLLVAILAAYAFSRFEFRFKKIINVIIVSVQAVPPITLLIPFFGLMVALHLYNTYAALILTYMVFTLPYAIIMMTGYFNTLPKELDEAVRVDGAGSMTALWRVLVPISVPGIVSIVKASQVNAKWQAGDVDGAQAASRSARNAAIACVIVSIVWTVVLVASGVVDTDFTVE